MSPLILTALIAVPLTGGGLALILGRKSDDAARWVSLLAALLTMVLAATLWFGFQETLPAAQGPVLEQRISWIPRYGIEFHLALDGLNLLFVVLTACLGTVAVLISWREVTMAVGAHYLCIMATVAGIMGVFLAYDLFLFYFFWELMLVPMYFLIGVWGHERRVAAAIKFTIFTMVSGLLLLVAILSLYYAHGAATGNYTMDYTRLLGTQIGLSAARWMFLGFVAAFAVKLPLFPFHTWLPDAHTQAPTAGSILLAGLLLKTGGYGLIRFAVPLFPDAAASLASPLAVLGVIGIIYGAILAYSQTDLKRMVAYSSVSHMGFVMLAVSAWQLTALQGAVMQMLAHGVATGAMFAIAGMIQERLHTRDLSELGGLWSKVPKMSAFALLFVLASVGLPGLGNFVGEFLVLLGSFPVTPVLVAGGVLGIVLGTIAMLALMQRAFYGPSRNAAAIADLSPREVLALGILAVAAFVLGLLPQPFLSSAEPALAGVISQNIPFNPADPEIDLDVQRTAAYNTADTSPGLPSNIAGARRPPVDPVPVAEPSVDLAEENATAATVSPTDPAEAPPASSRAGDEEGAS
jgi:NADH-quinone oxidoreductase subunit M